ncbi:hypothetical protein C0Z18_08185 [Trinickia dabaoshanensis]|uniref:Uncharacterized protein n=1 Tax=Trinickia dabaoshanensis TaxID=564714 RepID=A0A2N7VVI2_9BURK|nr:hypothetical protein [Trinickia dabaoshanensis]PMS21160.1 hypothetical protein C0Z18_08185 [Trinickia dabaoshanensis]
MSSSVEPPARALEQRTYDEWPSALRALFDGAVLASKAGFTASLITCDAGGHLRTSLLGAGELYAPDSRSIAFALWPSSRAARTLTGLAGDAFAHRPEPGSPARRRARAALTFVYEGAFHQVQLAVEPISGEAGATAGGLALFVASIEVGEAQQVGYARLTSGIAFALSGDEPERQAVLARWERQIDALREAANRRSPSGG